jgi:hypothetical protein
MLRALGTAGLAEQIEQIKITPQTLSTEEMSKLWTAFQAPYRPTTGYLATVVLIESRRPTRQTLPVRERIVKAIPFQRPTIESIESDAGADEPIVANSTIIIKGRQLRGAITSVLISGIPFIPAANDLGENEIKITLPPPLPDVLRAGIQSVQVVHEIDLGKPPVAHRAVESNVAAFILHPKLVPPFAPSAGKLSLKFDPSVGRSQRVTLLLGQRNPPARSPGRSFSIAAPPENGITVAGQTETATIEFSLQGVAADVYFLRVQVDGAESSLTIDGAGKFDGPTVTV